MKRITQFWRTALIVAIVAGGLWSASPAVSAEPLLERVFRDLETLSGTVSAVSEGMAVIALGAAQGVSQGDLFTIVQNSRLLSPQLGTRKGLLRVVQVKPEYSLAIPLDKASEIRKGDPVRRYEDIRATFWDYTGNGESLFFRIRNRLPSLIWVPYTSAQKEKPVKPELTSGPPKLFFVLSEEKLEIRDPDFELIHSYPVGELPEQKTGPAGPGSAGPDRPVAATESEQSGASAVIPPPVFPHAEQPALGGFQAVGNWSEDMMIADFLVTGRTRLMAVTDGKSIQVFDIKEKASPVKITETASRGKVVYLKWWKPKNSDEVCLAVTTWIHEETLATVYVLSGGRLLPMKEELPFILGTFDLDGDRTPEILMGQSFERKEFWGYQVKSWDFVNGALREASVQMEIPDNFTVAGSAFADLTGDGKLETVVVQNKRLHIYQGSELLYRLTEEMGGSLSSITYEIYPTARETTRKTVSFELSPTVADLDGDGRLELVVITSEGFFLNLGGTPKIKKSRLLALDYRDGQFLKTFWGDEIDAAIQGLAIASDTMMVLTSEPASWLGGKTQSHLLVYPLKSRF
jgi:hypothetical protein